MVVELLELRGEIDLNEKPNVTLGSIRLSRNRVSLSWWTCPKFLMLTAAGLAIFIDALQRIQRYGGKLVLAGLQNNVAMVFQIARLDKIFLIFDDREKCP